jgi:hypothetical protein
MARYVAAVANWTPTATADGSALTASGYHALRAGAASNVVAIEEVTVQGLVTATALNINSLRRHTTASTTPTNRVPAQVDPTGVASVFQGFITASTNPTVAALATIQHVLEMGINGYGGIYRWVAPGPESAIRIMTVTANNNEISISTVGTGASAQSSYYVASEL